MDILFKLVGIGMLLVFVLIIASVAVSKIDKISKDFAIGTKPWKGE